MQEEKCEEREIREREKGMQEEKCEIYATHGKLSSQLHPETVYEKNANIFTIRGKRKETEKQQENRKNASKGKAHLSSQVFRDKEKESSTRKLYFPAIVV